MLIPHPQPLSEGEGSTAGVELFHKNVYDNNVNGSMFSGVSRYECPSPLLRQFAMLVWRGGRGEDLYTKGGPLCENKLPANAATLFSMLLKRYGISVKGKSSLRQNCCGWIK
jgi:hypothetical protein